VHGLSAPRPFVRRGVRRAAIVRFRLPRAALVVFEVRQLSPACKSAGTFRVNGHAGLNRVRFAGRVGGRMLAPGTYELRARSRPSVRVRIAILPRHASATTVPARLRAASTCSVATLAGTASTTATATPIASATDAVSPAGTASGDAGGDGAPPSAGGVAGAESGEREAAPPTPPTHRDHPGRGLLPALPTPDGALGTLLLALLVAGIGAAMLLLGAAALPEAVGRRERFATVVADRRLELALAGTATLLVVTIAYLLAIA
jgi:hypothetical protein